MADPATPLRITYIGGPTALLEIGGMRLLTDPTFDPAGSEYPTPVYTLRKRQPPAIAASTLGRIDVVLLSHDHHFDNLDRAGRALLREARTVLTTPAGAERLGSPALGLAPWDTVELPMPAGGRLRVLGTPARHGPPDADRGPVAGFLLSTAWHPDEAIYVSGDTVWYEGVAEVARRARVRVAIINVGAARVREVGPAHLTFTATEAVQVARAFPDAVLVPLHYEGWEHFSEGRAELEAAFAAAGLSDRLRWLEPGAPTDITAPSPTARDRP